MKARCSDGREIGISGTADEWHSLADAVLVHNESVVCDASVDPSPYSLAAKEIRVSHDRAEKITIAVEEDSVTISGSSGSFQKLSELVHSFASEYRPGEHFHLDHIDGDCIDEKSSFVVLALNE